MTLYSRSVLHLFSNIKHINNFYFNMLIRDVMLKHFCDIPVFHITTDINLSSHLRGLNNFVEYVNHANLLISMLEKFCSLCGFNVYYRMLKY